MRTFASDNVMTILLCLVFTVGWILVTNLKADNTIDQCEENSQSIPSGNVLRYGLRVDGYSFYNIVKYQFVGSGIMKVWFEDESSMIVSGNYFLKEYLDDQPLEESK